MKWGEYSSDVQFMLQRSDQQTGNNSTGIKSPVSDLKAALATRHVQKNTAAQSVGETAKSLTQKHFE